VTTRRDYNRRTMACRCCGEVATVHARELCTRCYGRMRRWPQAHPGWKDRYPCSRRPSGLRRVDGVPAEPLLAAIDSRGGFRYLADRAGVPGRTRERDRLSLAIRRGRRRGAFTFGAADELATILLGERLDDIPGY
jgi:hypothetical protein